MFTYASHFALEVKFQKLVKLCCQNVRASTVTFDLLAEVKSNITQRLQDQFIQENKVKIQESEHLQTFYECIKDEKFGRSTYIEKVTSPHMRKLIARLRLNCSKLSPSPYSKIVNVCKECDTLLDIKHCILHCLLNKQKSDNFIDQVESILPGFKHLSPEQKFSKIMNLDFGNVSAAQSESAVAMVLTFIHSTYNDFLSGFWDSN